MVEMLAETGQGEVQQEEVEEWAEDDFGASGYYHHTEEEIADVVMGVETPVEEEVG